MTTWMKISLKELHVLYIMYCDMETKKIVGDKIFAIEPCI